MYRYDTVPYRTVRYVRKYQKSVKKVLKTWKKNEVTRELLLLMKL